MSDTEFLDNPAAVLNSMRALLAEPSGGEEALHPSGHEEKTVPPSKTEPAFQDRKGKGKFVPRGEGSSGLARVPPPSMPTEQPASIPSPHYSHEQRVLELLSTPPGEEVDASYVDVPSFPDLPTKGETSTPLRHDEDNEIWATKSEVHEIVETLDEFIKLEIQEALSPVLRDLKVLSADIRALSGASSALIQKISSLQVKVLNLEKTRPATITSSSLIAVAPTSQLTKGKGVPSTPESGLPDPAVALSPVARFLRAYPAYIETVILRKVRLTELARDMGYKGTLPAIGRTDWTEPKLTQKFSSSR
jgi:hypothetical protein